MLLNLEEKKATALPKMQINKEPDSTNTFS